MYLKKFSYSPSSEFGIFPGVCSQVVYGSLWFSQEYPKESGTDLGLFYLLPLSPPVMFSRFCCNKLGSFFTGPILLITCLNAVLDCCLS